MNTTFSMYHFVLFIYITIKSEGTARRYLRWGTWLDNLSIFQFTGVRCLEKWTPGWEPLG